MEEAGGGGVQGYKSTMRENSLLIMSQETFQQQWGCKVHKTAFSYYYGKKTEYLFIVYKKVFIHKEAI